ncbi:unnamed protein product [Boreogadus saida]
MSGGDDEERKKRTMLKEADESLKALLVEEWCKAPSIGKALQCGRDVCRAGNLSEESAGGDETMEATRSDQQGFLVKKKVPPPRARAVAGVSASSPKQGPVHLLHTQSQTSTSGQKPPEQLKARLRGWGPEACGARVDRRLRLETRGLQHRTRGLGLGLRRAAGGAETPGGRLGIDQQGFLNVFLERRRAGRGAVNLEDDHHSTNKDWKPGLWLRRADGGAKTLEDDITLPTRILTHLS